MKNCPTCDCDMHEMGCKVSGSPFHWCPRCGTIISCEGETPVPPAASRLFESFRIALGMISQLLSDRVPSMIAQAALDGADFTNEETALKVCEGKWRKPG